MAQDIDIGKLSEALNLKLDIDAKNSTTATEEFVKNTVEEELNTKVSLDTDQTISGVKTFESSPLVPTPADDATGQEAVNAAWCKENAGGGKDLNTGNKIYDWIGTQKEYLEQEIETKHPEYLCFITDDAVDPTTKLNTNLDNLDDDGQAILDAKANVSNTVTTDTEQEITGMKTFSSMHKFVSSENDASISVVNSNIETNATTPSIQQMRSFRNFANDGSILGDIRFLQQTDGTNYTQIYARKKIDGVEKSAVLGAYVDESGNATTTAVTVGTTSNSTAIATTAWINSKFQVVSALPATPDENVFYFIPES